MNENKPKPFQTVISNDSPDLDRLIIIGIFTIVLFLKPLFKSIMRILLKSGIIYYYTPQHDQKSIISSLMMMALGVFFIVFSIVKRFRPPMTISGDKIIIKNKVYELGNVTLVKRTFLGNVKIYIKGRCIANYYTKDWTYVLWLAESLDIKTKRRVLEELPKEQFFLFFIILMTVTAFVTIKFLI